jgi:hypothetical protein
MQTFSGFTVKFVNPAKPGKKNGTIKAEDESFFLVPKEMLDSFRPGVTYDLEYETHDYQGQTFKTVRKFTEKAAAAAASGGGATRSATNPTDSEQIFVTALMKEMIAAGKIDIMPETLTNQVRQLRAVWKNGFGTTLVRSDMGGDENPY